MSRWVIIAGLATILVSLVALAVLSGSSNQPATGESQQEPDTLEAPETPGEPTTPTTTPAEPTTPAPSTTEQSTGPETTTREEPPVQGIRPSDRRAAAPGPRVATVEVTGDAGYSCSIGRLDSPRTVRGTNPATYQVRVARGGSSLDTVMAVCQKINGEDLGVGIIYDGEVKAHRDTTERFGTVSVSWSPMQE